MKDAAVIRELEKEYEQKARRARYQKEERVRALFEKYPSLAEIDAQRREAVLEKFRCRRAQKSAEAEKLEAQITQFEARFSAELKALGVSPQELEPIYQCPK